jgi:hypothetical protein
MANQNVSKRNILNLFLKRTSHKEELWA